MLNTKITLDKRSENQFITSVTFSLDSTKESTLKETFNTLSTLFNTKYCDLTPEAFNSIKEDAAPWIEEAKEEKQQQPVEVTLPSLLEDVNISRKYILLNTLAGLRLQYKKNANIPLANLATAVISFLSEMVSIKYPKTYSSTATVYYEDKDFDELVKHRYILLNNLSKLDFFWIYTCFIITNNVNMLISWINWMDKHGTKPIRISDLTYNDLKIFEECIQNVDLGKFDKSKYTIAPEFQNRTQLLRKVFICCEFNKRTNKILNPKRLNSMLKKLMNK